MSEWQTKHAVLKRRGKIVLRSPERLLLVWFKFILIPSKGSSIRLSPKTVIHFKGIVTPIIKPDVAMS